MNQHELAVKAFRLLRDQLELASAFPLVQLGVEPGVAIDFAEQLDTFGGHVNDMIPALRSAQHRAAAGQPEPQQPAPPF
jgi:hypothetical protein